MTKAVYMRIGAMLAVLTVLAGAFAALPYWTAAAEDKTIFGFVDQCGANPPEFLDSVAVSLVDAQGILATRGATTSGGGFYEFTPEPANYLLRFSASGYYSREIGPFRFDGGRHLREDTCLTKMPNRDASLQVLVVDSVNTTQPDEQVNFTRTFVALEDLGPRIYQVGVQYFTSTMFSPVWSTDHTIRWKGQFLNPGVDYQWSNAFNGTLEILNGAVSSDVFANRRFLNATYWYASPTSRLNYYPVVPGTVTVKKDTVAWGVQSTEWDLDLSTGIIRILRDFLFGVNVLTVNYQSTQAIAGATVNLYDKGQKQVVSTADTNATGFATISIWRAILELQASKDQYQPRALDIDTNTVNFTRVIMTRGIVIVGHAFRSDNGRPITQGVVGFLYNTGPSVQAFRKVIEANVSGSLYRFFAEASQTYRMVVDADGFSATIRTITTPASPPFPGNPLDSYLAVSKNEVYRTTVTYPEADWNNVRVSWNLTLRSDSTIPALKLPEIRSLELQVDYNFGLEAGTADGTWSLAERTAFENWLRNRLPAFVTTDNFLTTNGETYNSTAGLLNPPNYVAEGGTAIWINTTAMYPLRAPTAIVNDRPTYYVNVSARNDVNQSVYQDRVVVVDFPRGYEMTDKSVTGPITTTGFTVVTIDPGVSTSSSPSDIAMTVRKSENGTARAMVVGPVGKFHVLSSTDKNYTAVVAADTNITFSAEQSIDPVGNIRDANFTWRFANNTGASDQAQRRYNITTTFNYSSQFISSIVFDVHEFIVNLTVVEAGGNRTYRDIKVFVDDVRPIAELRTNRTTGNATGIDLPMNEDSPIKFEGSFSRDTAYAGAPAWVNRHKDNISAFNWDYDADHVTDSHLRSPVTSFEKPGWYNTTLQVVDWVGHNSTVNATIKIVANDKTKPTASFVILDPSKDWVVTSSLVEGKNYTFNASSSLDNYDENRNLSYAWHFPGPVTCTPACDSNGNISKRRGYIDGITWGWNVTVWWREFNVSYNVTLNVTDTGFLGGTPNYGNVTQGIAVSVDVAQHPDLKVVAASLKIEPGQPEEGTVINVSLMIENAPSRANATSVTVVLTAKDPNGAVVLQNGDPQWKDERWVPLAEKRVDAGKKVRLTFLISFPAQGNKTIEVKFQDSKEPYTWVDGQNRATGSVFVKLAGWVIPGAIIGFIALVVGVAFAARTYSRYRSGELVFRRREKKEKKKLEDKGEEEEEPEPEQDTKGKKRL